MPMPSAWSPPRRRSPTWSRRSAARGRRPSLVPQGRRGTHVRSDARRRRADHARRPDRAQRARARRLAHLARRGRRHEGAVITLGEELDGVTYLAGEGAPDHGDPHVSMDVANGSKYVDHIEAALRPPTRRPRPARSGADRVSRPRWGPRWPIRDRLLDAGRRSGGRLFHDTFRYFAAAYGLTIVGTVVDAPGQDPSAGASRPRSRDAAPRSDGDLLRGPVQRRACPGDRRRCRRDRGQRPVRRHAGERRPTPTRG